MQVAARLPRSSRSAHRRISSASSVDDDAASVSSVVSSANSRSAGKFSHADYSAIRAAAGISRMRQGGRRRRTLFSDNPGGGVGGGLTEVVRGGRRTSIYSLSALADAGKSYRKRRRSTFESWGKAQPPGVKVYFDKLLPPDELFRRSVKLVQMFASLCQYKYEKENEEQELPHTVFTQYISEDDTKMDAGLMFDASIFKSNRKMRVSNEVKSILTLPPDQRAEQQEAKVLFSLRTIRAFAEYPQRIQQKLVRVGWYEAHHGKRAILRQGHIPQAFYFVLSGSAVVTVMEEMESFARTVTFLRRGDSFGELAILHDTRRQSTVISREPIELLVVSREDFIDIFMCEGGMKNINDPDHQQFIKSIDFLKGWPINLMAKNPKKCLFHFFRSGSVLVKDSNHSDWIYILKSGSCQVLKKLKQVKSCLTEHKERVVGFENVKSAIPKARSSLDRVRTKLSVVTLLLPRLKLKSRDLSTLTENEEQPQNSSANDELAITRVAAAQSSSKTGETEQHETVEKNDKTELRAGRRVGIVETTRRASIPKVTIARSKKVTYNNGVKSVTSSKVFRCVTADDSDKSRKRIVELFKGVVTPRSPELVSPPKSQRKLLTDMNKFKIRMNRRLSPKGAPSSEEGYRPQSHNHDETGKRKAARSARTHKANANEDEEENNIPRQRKSVIDAGELKQSEVRITEADLHPMFVQVSLLSKGDTFGLNTLVFDEQPSLSLVSNGAECIGISKKFFLEHCTEAHMRRLMVTETPYPDDETLQKNLQDKINWDTYKKKTLRSTVKQLRPSVRRTQDLEVHRRSRSEVWSLSEDLKAALKKLHCGEEKWS